jgi:uncharacterized protein DUF4157
VLVVDLQVRVGHGVVRCTVVDQVRGATMGDVVGEAAFVRGGARVSTGSDRPAVEAGARSGGRSPVPVGASAGYSIADLAVVAGEERFSDVVRGGGTRLAPAARAEMEVRFDADFSDVRVHTGDDARRSAAELGASAYTSGNHIVVGAGGMDRHTLAHELVHVLQQRRGPVDGTDRPDGPRVSDPRDRFEREAELAARRALSGDVPSSTRPRAAALRPAGLAATPVVQRRIVIGNVGHSAAETAARLEPQDRGEAVTHGILPQLDHGDRRFTDLGELRRLLADVRGAYEVIWNPRKYVRTLGELHATQKGVQATIVGSGLGRYRGLITTVGLEHEFASVPSSSVLGGLTHLKLAESTETWAVTGLPWVLETDSSNALELVTPPLVVPTVLGRPLPSPDAVEPVVQVVEKELVALVDALGPGLLTGGRKSVLDLVTALHTAGIPMAALRPVVVLPEHVTPGTNFGQLKDQDVTSRLTEVEVFANAKHGRIDTQLNIATDLETIIALEKRGTPAESGFITRFSKREQWLIDTVLPVPKDASPQLALFYEVMCRKLAGLYALGAMAALRAVQHDVHAKHVRGQQPLTHDSQAQLNHMGELGKVTSFVKDVTPVWVKDHLVSIMTGLLGVDDLPLLTKGLREGIARLGAAKVTEKGEAEARFRADLRDALEQLLRLVGSNDRTRLVDLGNEHKPVAFLGHDAEFIGVRQDTHLPPAKVQLPEVWPGVRLHVGEVRKNNVGALRRLVADLRAGPGLPPLVGRQWTSPPARYQELVRLAEESRNSMVGPTVW